MATSKVNWISIVQAWAILMVIVGHLWNLPSYIHDFIYAHHMSLFMFMSGFLFYKTRITKNCTYLYVIKDKTLRLCIPYIVFTTIAFIPKLFLSTHMKNSIEFSFANIISGYIIPSTGPLKEMWFVATLYLIMLLYPILKKISNRKFEIIILLISLLLYFCIPVQYIGGGILNINGIPRYLCFFILGIVFSKHNLIQYLNNNYIIAIVFIIYTIFCPFWRDFPFIFALLGIIMSTSCCYKISLYKPTLFSSFRDYTFQIFLIGIFPQMFIELFIAKSINNQYLILTLSIISIVTAIYIPVLLSRLSKTLNNKILNLSLGLK